MVGDRGAGNALPQGDGGWFREWFQLILNAVISPRLLNLLFLSDCVEADLRGGSLAGWNAVVHRDNGGLGRGGFLRPRRTVAN